MNIIMLRKVIFISILFFSYGQAQVSQPALDFIKNFKASEQEFPRERIYLHTDRDWYFFGDRIWFSAYVVAGPYNFNSELSKVLYVEFYEPKGDMIERVAIELSDGRGQGSLTFGEEKVREGKYRIKAYTAWALNFGESYTFKKDIQVFADQTFDQKVLSDNDFDVQFFPESGWLIEGIPTRVGFKAIKSDGYGLNVQGALYSDGVELTQFQSSHLGMGDFEITPESNKSYYAVINEERFELPVVVSEGTSLRLNDSGTEYELNVHVKSEVLTNSLLVFAHVRGEVFSAEVISIEDGYGTVSIPKDKFPTGIVHFTILNEEGFPEAERLVFNKNEVDKLDVSFSLSEQRISLREENGIRLRIIDGYEEAASATASISIFDDQPQAYNPFKSTIYTRFYLETELQGFVEQPGYYFSGSEDAGKHLDLLLLTQGWRAYNMMRIKRSEPLELVSLPEKGFKISGQVKGGFFKRSQKNAPVFFSLGETEQATLVTADERGRFVIPDLTIRGVMPFEIKANSESGKTNVDIHIDDQFGYLPEQEEKIFQTVSGIELENSQHSIPEETEENFEEILARVKSAQEEAELLIDAQMELELDEITVTSDRLAYSESVESNDYATQIVKNTAGRSATLNVQDYEYTDHLRTSDLINQIPGARVINNRLFIERIGLNTSFLTSNEPLVLLNGSVTSFNIILGMQPEDIETVTVLRSEVDLAIFGAQAIGGALVVTSKRGERYLGQRGLIRGKIGGYQIPAEFYMPKYGVTVPRELDQEDNRITLLWEPLIEVSRRGIQLPFWANDAPSTYRVVLEGITELGTPFYHTEIFEIAAQ